MSLLQLNTLLTVILSFPPLRSLRLFLLQITYPFRYPGLSLSLSSHLLNYGDFSYGSDCVISSNCLIDIPGAFSLANEVIIHKSTTISAHNITIGSQTSLQTNVSLLGNITIGSFCLIAPRVFISSGSHSFKRNPPVNIRDQDLLPDSHYSSLVTIEEDCWIGVNSVILPGVTIGKGSVVGANSVVTMDVPPYTVVGGAPAKPISTRLHFSPPSTILATDSHVPYLYRGFNTRSSFRRDLLIRLASCNFAICINTKGKSMLHVAIQNVSCILSGGLYYYVNAGIASLPISQLESDNLCILLNVLPSEREKATISCFWTK